MTIVLIRPGPRPGRVKAQQDAGAFLQDMRHFAGLLAERGRDAFGFLHLTFQEYFAGRALAWLDPEARWAMIASRLHQPRWREPILLCVGQLGVIEQRRDRVNELAQQILKAGSEHETILQRDLFLTATLATDDVGLSPALLDELDKRLASLVYSPIPTVQRMAVTALAHLARLGHEEALQSLLEGVADQKIKRAVMANVRPVLGEVAGTDLRQAIRHCLKDNDNDVWGAAVQALAGLVSTDPQVRTDLLACLKDNDSDVRSS